MLLRIIRATQHRVQPRRDGKRDIIPAPAGTTHYTPIASRICSFTSIASSTPKPIGETSDSKYTDTATAEEKCASNPQWHDPLVPRWPAHRQQTPNENEAECHAGDPNQRAVLSLHACSCLRLFVPRITYNYANDGVLIYESISPSQGSHVGRVRTAG